MKNRPREKNEISDPGIADPEIADPGIPIEKKCFVNR
jgi:hypothetical protein